jgi:formaldehyde-activating enzyme involved in methanogenesis
MKVVLLDEVERFCEEHNFSTVGLYRLQMIAVDNDQEGLEKAYMEGYAACHDAVTKAMAQSKPEATKYASNKEQANGSEV